MRANILRIPALVSCAALCSVAVPAFPATEGSAAEANSAGFSESTKSSWQCIEAEQNLHCAHAAAPSSSFKAGAKYAPDRQIDALHIAIDVTPDFKARTLAGKTAFRFAPILAPLRELRLDQVDLKILSVESDAAVKGWTVGEDSLVVTFAEPIPVGRESEVRIEYSAEPAKGIYFRTPEMGYKPEDAHLWSQGEPQEARHWFPSFDYPNDKFTSEVVCRVPPDMSVFSNGHPAGETVDPKTGLKAVRWVQDKPHSNYLIALAAGHFKTLRDDSFRVPLALHVPASQIDHAQNAFRDTGRIIRFFESEIGVPYPWDKYDQVVVDDFIWGGMENTSLTILTDHTLYPDGFEGVRDSNGLVAHEMAHQWFGDYATCKDWSQIWLNEGFATYYAHLFDGEQNGRDDMLYGLFLDARKIFNSGDLRPIVSRAYDDESDVFGVRAYEKGSWVLHMLRSRLGEDVYRRVIKAYLERNAFGSSVTEDLRSVLEKETGQSHDEYFDRWVFHGGWPKLKVTTDWNEAQGLARVVVEQTQEINEKTPLFDIPAKVRFTTAGGDVDREIKIDAARREFFFALPSQPTMTRFDPDYGILAQVSFTPSNPMLFAQLEKSDAIGRLLAIEALKDRDDKETVEGLRKRLNEDPFWGVRVEAATALRQVHTPEALDALVQSIAQPDARVRRRVVEEIGAFYDPAALRALLASAGSEPNPDVKAKALEALGKFEDPEARKTLLGALGAPSFRDATANAALRGVRSAESPDLIPPTLDFLNARKDLSSETLGQAMDTLATLARHQENRDAARDVITARVNDPRRGVQAAAIRALGTLGDPRARATLKTFANGPEDGSARKSAEAALKKLDETAHTPEELATLREETLALKKSGEETRKELDELKARFDAKSAAPAGASNPAPAVPADGAAVAPKDQNAK